MAFNSTNSTLSFRADVTAEEGSVNGQNIFITVPSEISNYNNVTDGNVTILVYLFVDGSHNGYIQTATESGNRLGFYLYEGNHMVNLAVLDPVQTVPEMSPLALEVILASLFIEALLVAKLYVRVKQRRLEKML